MSGTGDFGDGEDFPAPPGPAGSARRVEQGRPSGSPRSTSHRRRRRRWPVIVLLIGAPVIFVLAAITLWYELNAHALGPEGRQVVITIHDGESADSVVSALASDHVIASSLAFKFGDLINGTPTISPGSYALHENQTYGEVRTILNGGPNISVVNVRAGLTLHEIAQRVDPVTKPGGSTFEQLAASGAVHSVFSPPGSNNLEGLLGPGTYLVLPGQSRLSVLQAMVTRFDQQATAAGLSQAAASAFGLTPYEMITAASVVEKEGYYPKNMPDVARVVYNRLANSMPLQMDSTVLYALGQDGGTVTPADLQIQSPYNTYLNKGLPPTPICTVSSIALAAAVHPPAGGWLYFVVVTKDGTEAFSDTFAGQQANEQLAKSRGLG
jgi:UPF0755 protein